MKTTKEKIEEKIKIMQAYVDGTPIQFKVNRDWVDCDDCISGQFIPNFNWGYNDFRIKPEPKKIPLDESDIILGTSVLRWEPSQTVHDHIILNKFNNGIDVVIERKIEFIPWSGLDSYRINHNNGIGEWLPCEKEAV